MSKSKLYTKTLTLPNGKRKYIRATTKEELEKKYNAISAEVGLGVDVTDTSTVAELAQMWYDYYKKPHLKTGGQVSVKNTVNQHILPIIGQMRVRDVKEMHIQQVMAAESGMSKSLQDKTRQALNGMFKAAVKNNLIARSPVPDDLKSTGKDTEEKIPLTVKQSQQLLRTVRPTRAYTCVLLMLTAGLRREEACGLMWQDIDFDKHEIHVRRVNVFYGSQGMITTELKSKAAKRDIPVPEWVVEELRAEHAKSSSPYVLHKQNGQPMSSSAFKNMWAAITARTTDNTLLIGKPSDPRHPNVKYGIDFHVHPHKLRHTCITRWFDAGLDVKTVQYLAGHATPAITLKIYDHYMSSLRQEQTAQKIKTSEVLAALAV